MGKFDKDSLGNRMKHNYEEVSKTRLVRRMPVICRLDGKSFHTFTKGFKKPFDDILIGTMQNTMKYLCQNIQGCVLGYTQSDEITLVLVDYQTLKTDSWYDYEVQKLCSVSASMATLEFNRQINGFFNNLCPNDVESFKYFSSLSKAINKGAVFDSRCFNIPKEEVTNCVLWRQQDATRNSIQMVGQSQFSQKELDGKNCSEIQDMLIEKGINWNDFPTYKKRGSCCIKKNGFWKIDKNIPIFTGEGRKYIDDLVFVGE